MKNRGGAIILLVLFTIATMGCGKEAAKESTLDRVSTVNYNAGLKILEYADAYISFSLSEDEFDEKYEELHSKMVTEKPRDALISSASYSLKEAIRLYEKGTNDFDGVIEARDHLAEYLEEPLYENATRQVDNESNKRASTSGVTETNESVPEASVTSQEDVYEELASGTYQIIDRTKLNLALYRQPSTGLKMLSATIEADDFPTIKQMNDILLGYTLTNSSLDEWSLIANINEDMVFWYTYDLKEKKIKMIFGKETLDSELELKAPSWALDDSGVWDDELKQGKVITNTGDSYNTFIDKCHSYLD